MRKSTEYKFLKFNGLDFNYGVADNGFENFKYGKNNFDFYLYYYSLIGLN